MKIKQYISDNISELQQMVEILGQTLPEAIYNLKSKDKELSIEELTDILKDFSDLISCTKDFIKSLEEDIQDIRKIEKIVLEKIQ